MTDDRVSTTADTPDEGEPTTDDDQALDDDDWVLLPTAAEAVGRSVSALRKRYSGGDLEVRKDDQGRVMLNLGEVRRLIDTPARARPATALPQVTFDELTELWDRIVAAEAKAAVAAERERHAHERRKEAEQRAADLEAELAAFRDTPPKVPDPQVPDPSDQTTTTPTRLERLFGRFKR